MKRRLLSAAGGLCLAVAMIMGAPAQAKDDALLTLSAGLFDIESSRAQEFEGRLEYRFSYGLFESDGAFRGFKPLVGVMGNSAGSVFGYAGLAAPLSFADGLWEIVPAAGVGAYRKGGRTALDLGGTFEFHLGLGASYAVTRHNRIGIAVNHISNARTHRKNPGVNSIVATWAFGFR